MPLHPLRSLSNIANSPNAALKSVDLVVSRETLERLTVFAELAWRWNNTVNLFVCPDRPTLWSRHVLDSLQLVKYLQPNTKLALDMGSGAGFPGLVLAISTGLPFILVEADHRKAAFLREAARQTQTIVDIRVERVARVAAHADLITARALGRLNRLLCWASPLLASNGACLFLKGNRALAELREAEQQWTMSVQAFPSRTDQTGMVLKIERIVRRS